MYGPQMCPYIRAPMLRHAFRLMAMFIHSRFFFCFFLTSLIGFQGHLTRLLISIFLNYNDITLLFGVHPKIELEQLRTLGCIRNERSHLIRAFDRDFASRDKFFPFKLSVSYPRSHTSFH